MDGSAEAPPPSSDSALEAEGPPAAPDGLDGREAAKHFAFSLVIGVMGAMTSVVLSLAVDFAGGLASRFPWLLLALPAFGALSVALYRALKLPVNLATDTVVASMRGDRRVPLALSPGILLGTCLTVAGGGSVGKEAAVMQMGASLGSAVARPFKLRSVRRRNRSASLEGYAAACGMAAALSALFFAPLGSTMFVLELMRFRGTIVRHAASMLVGAFVAFAIARVVGVGDAIPRVDAPGASWELVVQCLVVGVSAAVAGAVFADALRAVRSFVRRRVAHSSIAVVSGGLLFAGLVLAFGWQSFEGTGMPLLRGALAGDAGGADFAVKALLTALVLGFGFKGGEIMPLFTIGALLGCALGHLTGFSPAFSAVLGLTAFFAAASRCPLAAALMGAELFGLAAAPAIALAVAVSFVGGRGAGVFGRDVATRFVRARRRPRSGGPA